MLEVQIIDLCPQLREALLPSCLPPSDQQTCHTSLRFMFEPHPVMNQTTSKDPAQFDQTNHCDQQDLIMDDSGHINDSPLFTALPLELRLQIYEELFEGSIAKYKKKHTVGSQTQLSVLLPSNHHNFLLTCNQAYDEAIKAYWSKTTLCGDPDDDELTFFLGCIVPDFAKAHIQHIRGLNSGCLPDRPVDECLRGYPRLQTVGFEEEWFVDVALLGDRGAFPTLGEWAEEHCLAQSSWKFSKLLCDRGPAVVFRGVYGLDLGEDKIALLEEKFPGVAEDYQNERKICFYNCSTDWGFFADGSPQEQDQDAGFARVIEGYGPEVEDCGSSQSI